MATHAQAWFLTQPGQPLQWRELTLDDPRPGEAVVEVLACGLCHTDLGYADGSVAPKHALPLVLGHEAVGIVRQVGDESRLSWIGQTVLIPAVLPCGTCAWCTSGHANACPKQVMPGNDDHGGFSTHLKVPAAPLQLLGAQFPGDVRHLSVVADAVSTGWQAVKRSGLQAGDVAFVVGTGGVGAFVGQIARALGATVIGLDTDDSRLQTVLDLGVQHGVVVAGRTPKDVKTAAHALAKSTGVASLHWRIFECSGALAGQALAWSLLARSATYVQVGYAAGPVELRLSNLMAFDGVAHGTWGCPPEEYPGVLSLIANGTLQVAPLVDYAPLSRVNELLADMAGHRLTKRMILDPRLG